MVLDSSYNISFSAHDKLTDIIMARSQTKECKFRERFICFGTARSYLEAEESPELVWLQILDFPHLSFSLGQFTLKDIFLKDADWKESWLK